jgi:hypothetical protein
VYARIVVKLGARVSIVPPLNTSCVVHARALDTELAGFQLARVEGDWMKLMLTREGLTWARGWNTKAAKALRVVVALTPT